MALSEKDDVKRWKKKLEKEPDENTVLSIIHKLSKISITVEILQDTGIGKVIRTLAKKPGKVGEKAKAVLHNWREVVACSQKTNESLSKHAKASKKENINKDTSFVKGVSSKQISRNHEIKQQKHCLQFEHKQKPHINESSKELNLKTIRNDSEDAYSEDDHTELIKPSPYTYHKAEVSTNYIDYDPHSDDINLGYNPDHPELYPGSTKTPKKIIKVSSAKVSIFDSSKGESSSAKRKISLNNVLDNTNISHKTKKVKTEEYQPSTVSSSGKDKYKGEKSKTHSPSKDKMKSKKTSLSSGGTDDSHHKSPNISKATQMSSESKKSSKVKETSDKKSSSSKKNKLKLKIQTAVEFTSSEVSFEDCLGFNDIVTVKKKKAVKPSSSSKKTGKLTQTSSVKNSEHSVKEKVPQKILPSNSPEDSIELSSRRIEVDVVSTLPQPQPNYRPLPQRSLDALQSKKKVLSNEEAIKFTSSRREKTAVYSGRKNCHFTEVPTLFEFCTRVLIDNIDAIEYMGDVPYFLLKPVLERCNPLQLYQIEHYNPYLLEDTHELWEIHCKRDYRTYTPEENETWRDLYWRASEERERKLKSITAHISASMSKSNPVRQVKLAYVDSVVKPPRDVARKQAKHGTALPVNHTVKAGPPVKASPKPSASAISSASSSSSTPAPKKNKVAPLMAKTLKSMKMCYRR